MTTRNKNFKVGAVVRNEVIWNQLDWYRINDIVSKLQRRIVEAQKQGRYGKVKALQYLLTHSFSAKALAVRKVTENKGKRTPGVDGEVWPTAEKKSQAIKELKRRGYQPKPLRRTYIEKANGKLRPLGIPTIKDRAMQALHTLALDPVSETAADTNSFGFRKKRSTTDAKEQCFLTLSRTNCAQWVLDCDIKSCFDKINHEWLLANIPMDKSLLRKWLKAGYIEKHIWNATDEGTPQGSIISPVLSNMTLDKLQRTLKYHFPIPSSNSRKVNLIRYCDDFVITGDSKEVLEQEVKPLLESFLKERGLELSQEKTQIVHIDEGFDFLGFNIRKYKGKLLIKPAKKKILGVLEKIRSTIKANKQTPAGKLIALLNQILRGWCNYYKSAVSKKAFKLLRARTFQMIWKWAKRRHPMKSIKWIKGKYFKTIGKSNWEFFGIIKDKKNSKEIVLFNTEKVRIVRHIKVKGEANPYTKEWEGYFRERGRRQIHDHLSDKKHILFLWNKQNGICPVCKQEITIDTGWQNHHITWKVVGGKDTSENRMLLHQTCHGQVHHGVVSV